jgi:hypothetical protein
MKFRSEPHKPGPWWTANKAAAYCRCSRKTLYRAVRLDRLKAVRLTNFGDRHPNGCGVPYRFRREWLDAWLNGNAPDSASGGRSGSESRNPEGNRETHPGPDPGSRPTVQPM